MIKVSSVNNFKIPSTIFYSFVQLIRPSLSKRSPVTRYTVNSNIATFASPKTTTAAIKAKASVK